MPRLAPLLAFAAHPDDLEFAAGAVIAKEVRAARRACHFVICSRGESASRGTPAQRTREAKAAAKILGATLEFITLGGDGHLKARSEYTVRVAGIIRKHRPSIVLAPTSQRNQHPDHGALGLLTQNAARLARYGGLRLKKQAPHAIDALLFYAVTAEAEPKDVQPFLVDVSDGATIEQWTRAMSAHTSQLKTRNYVELQLTRARLWGLRAGVEFAVPLFPNDPLVFETLASIGRTARRF